MLRSLACRLPPIPCRWFCIWSLHAAKVRADGKSGLLHVVGPDLEDHDRRLQESNALVECLALDEVTAWRVFSLERYARDDPDTPVAEVLTEGEREVIGIVVRGGRLLPPAERGQPFPTDIRW